MARLSSHVLDATHGCPAAGLRIDLYRVEPQSRRLVTTAVTDEHGRTSAPLLEDTVIPVGCYQLVFHAGDYFRSRGMRFTEPAFLDEVTVAFGIADAGGNYHVPLLLSPYGYTTYRGS